MSDNNPFESDLQLGSLSAKYESNGDPGTVVDYRGPGGKSYGAYQFSLAAGTPYRFLEWLKTEDIMSYNILTAARKMDGDKLGRNFDFAWQKLACDDEAGFLKLQHDFVKAKYFDAAAAMLKRKHGFDIITRSLALQCVLWSTAVQHGTARAVSILNKSGLAGSDRDIISGVYNERCRVVSYDDMVSIKGNTNNIHIIDGGSRSRMLLADQFGIRGKVMVNFYSSSADVQVAVFMRFIKEKQDALRMLGQLK
ncbi:MAG: hypothetical protein ACM3PP_04630 [Candidatus Saccharibacteria bacterium]